MMQCGRNGQRQAGFTLVELIMVIALAGTVAVLVGTALNRPLQAFVDQRNRAELTDQAAVVLDRITRDIHLALPNSVRLGNNGQTLELISIAAAGRYRANTLAGSAERFDPPRCAANALCNIPILGPVDTTNSNLPHYLVIYNTSPNDIWSQGVAQKVFTWNAGDWADGNGTLTGDFRTNASGLSFPQASPQHRFYLAREAVRYSCAAGNFIRAVNTGDFTQDNWTQNVISNRIGNACAFAYDPGTLTRNGLATIQLSLTHNGESITLYRQVQVNNAP
ncbi:hypothetical protein DNJ95_01870 [Stutzerimonas kirkiae]|uniref:MSHA biogenesis protein MshO n=1 Tax=Stutzerimonas kirkiae TaxID=2211392 RepID=A0A4Q9RFF5_9GAMM|nr:type II secretion system protein [Stutzerimonas kirkiae]TBU99941.1 hypothetical protein DNJ96_01200 [Stutzerimonas kirkiae]TBV05647.1 hypothetical protein DNJ95_01870 [Stutzerimonas kirkiae]TBV17467.1 hypothetical protein DNK01_01015 [Stutzerimonas kirkiae]